MPEITIQNGEQFKVRIKRTEVIRFREHLILTYRFLYPYGPAGTNYDKESKTLEIGVGVYDERGRRAIRGEAVLPSKCEQVVFVKRRL